MKLINRIWIKYFRSIYYADLKVLDNVNVFSGRNDAGKSNVIKALNLFFNGSSEYDMDFSFYENFSLKRLEEVKRDSIKGKQFISIKIEFVRPKNYRGSLPETFTVERQWQRDESRFVKQKDNLSTQERNGRLPSTRKTAERSLSKLLNRIHFEYVPAIRDRQYTQSLLARLQSTLLVSSPDSDLVDTAKNLAEHIENQVGGLKNDFHLATGLATAIEPPGTPAALFRSFFVSTDTDDGTIPLNFRGDGLQARYIASVLGYIAAHSSDFFIWGYEEPEIALEYAHSTRLAHDFETRYSNDAQIFLSTHSPAFLALKGDVSRCFRVAHTREGTEIFDLKDQSDTTLRGKLRQELGIVEIQREAHERMAPKLERLKEFEQKVTELELSLADVHRPVLVTEGATDVLILEAAAQKLGFDLERIAIRSCDNSGDSERNGGIGGARMVAQFIESTHPDDDRLAIGVFDNDNEGRKAFNGLTNNFSEALHSANVKMHRNRMSWAIILPEPSFREGYADYGSLCIEFLFRDHVLAMELSNGETLEIRPNRGAMARLSELPLDTDDGEMGRVVKEMLDRNRIIGSGKTLFAKDVVPELEPEEFSAFRELFGLVEAVLGQRLLD